MLCLHHWSWAAHNFWTSRAPPWTGSQWCRQIKQTLYTVESHWYHLHGSWKIYHPKIVLTEMHCSCNTLAGKRMKNEIIPKNVLCSIVSTRFHCMSWLSQAWSPLQIILHQGRNHVSFLLSLPIAMNMVEGTKYFFLVFPMCKILSDILNIVLQFWGAIL